MSAFDFDKLIKLVMIMAMSSCAVQARQSPGVLHPLTLKVRQSSSSVITAEYRLSKSAAGLHFARELGGYRKEAWRPADSAFQWTREGNGERIERHDGRPFNRVTLTIPVDYRALPKSYAPFSPFSEGSTLIHSGQFHACIGVPCEGTDALPISIEAKSKTVGLEGRRTRNRDRFVSRGEGTSVFVGTLEPIEADGFVAIIDPGLPAGTREHLDRSLPQSIQFFDAIYGSLSFKPDLYVSIDESPEAAGHVSSQGGTLPNQIFMHFDGENAGERLTSGEPYWLDWFFAHEAAHLFQQDKIGKLAGDDQTAWLHEGGADAMAALAMVGRGEADRSYVQKREREAEAACAGGLAKSPLNRATADGNFDVHYKCGLLIWLALDQDLRRAGRDGLNDLNRVFFSRVKGGQPWTEKVFLESAQALGASGSLLSKVAKLSKGGYGDAAREVDDLGVLARQSLMAKAAG